MKTDKILVTGGSGFIGTNLVAKLLEGGYNRIVNIDTAKPNLPEHDAYWQKESILDKESIFKIFTSFQPDAVIHLAARTDTDPANVLSDYVINTTGTENLVAAIKAHPSVKRLILTSTQFVHQYKGMPQNDEDFAPHTVYGESKVMTEKLVRNAGLACIWTIIRPTNIWGPWHLRYPSEFWKVLSKGLYFHPGRQPVMRSYGYVGNVVAQVISIMEGPREKVNKQVYYVGDEPIDLYDWANGFSIGQIGKPVRVVPRFLVRGLALAGDVFAKIGLRFPITTSRYKSMTTSNVAPMEKTIEAFGQPPYSLQQGILESVEWMRKYHPDLVRTRKAD